MRASSASIARSSDSTLSRTSNFAAYTAGGFTLLDQHRLQRAVIGAAQRGAVVLVSNSSAPEIEAAYTTRAARMARLSIERVHARRAINSRAALRGPVHELVITNAPAVARMRMARASLRARNPHERPAARARKRQA